MTSRNIFNRSYTSYTSNGSQVWLVNGGGTTSSYTSPYVLFAGENLTQGDVVYTSGNSLAVKATALSGVATAFYYPIGVAAYTLQSKLPGELKGRLPTAKQLADIVRLEMDGGE